MPAATWRRRRQIYNWVVLWQFAVMGTYPLNKPLKVKSDGRPGIGMKRAIAAFVAAVGALLAVNYLLVIVAAIGAISVVIVLARLLASFG